MGLRRIRRPRWKSSCSPRPALIAAKVAGSRRAMSWSVSAEISRLRGDAVDQFLAQRFSQGGRGGQCEIDQPGFDRIKIFPGLVEPIEGRLKLSFGRSRHRLVRPLWLRPARPFARPYRRYGSCSGYFCVNNSTMKRQKPRARKSAARSGSIVVRPKPTRSKAAWTISGRCLNLRNSKTPETSARASQPSGKSGSQHSGRMIRLPADSWGG